MGKFNVGLQLFSIRDEMEADPRGTLKQVREMGYDCVESAGYCGLSPEDFRAAVEEAGLKLVSTHTMLPPTLDGIPAIVAEQKTLGVSYMAIPWMNKDRTPGEANYESTREMIAAICEAFHGTGLQLLYHNHDFEFDFLGG
ncbi:MAG: hypothetical protein IKT60_00615, partial [Clostridia bacterium]|nr:hypothetical protein [Clostridia bacterium]